jgi:hypothetical protein
LFPLTIDEIKERSPTGISGPKRSSRGPRAKSVISTYECSQFRTEFAADSPLEEAGFEPSVPRDTTEISDRLILRISLRKK